MTDVFCTRTGGFSVERLNIEQIDKEFYYTGEDLGATVMEDKTLFKTWSPYATGVYLNLYLDGKGDNKMETLPMEKIENGVWYVELFRNCDGEFYTFTYEFNYGKEKYESIDIYAKGCGVNGDRGAVIDFRTTDPMGWNKVPQSTLR